MELRQLKDSTFFKMNGCLYAILSKHGNGLAQIRQIANDRGLYADYPVEHLLLSVRVEPVQVV